MSKELYSNLKIGFLNGDVSSTSSTSIALTLSTMFPSTGNFTVKCDDEIMLVTANTSNSFTVVRGQEGTTAATHSDTAPIFSLLTDGSLRRLVRQSHGGTLVGARREINFVDGGGVTFSLSDDGTNDKVDVSAVVASGYEAPYTVPVLSDFTWVNQGAGTATSKPNGFFMNQAALAGNNVRALVKTIATPGSPWTVTIKVLPMFMSGDPSLGGIILKLSSGAPMIQFSLYGANLVFAGKYNSVTSYSGSNYFSKTYMAGFNGLINWLRLQDDGTNLLFSASNDGYTFQQLFSVSRTDYLTDPDQVGFFVDCNASSNDAAMNCLSFALSQP